MNDKHAQANRYAQAVVAAMLDKWETSLNQAATTFESDAALADMLGDSSRSADEKRKALTGALPTDTPAEVINLLLLMGESGDLDLVGDVTQTLVETISGQQSPTKAEVVSAIELSEDDKEQIRRKLSGQYGESLVFSFRVDPSLMGGLRVRVGDRLIDTSVASRLATLRESLSSAVR